MPHQRRDVLKLAGAAALTGLVGPAFAKQKPLRVLILGGTGFIGPHFVYVLTAAGHKISLFNRGKRDTTVRPGIEYLVGDRNGPDGRRGAGRLGCCLGRLHRPALLLFGQFNLLSRGSLETQNGPGICPGRRWFDQWSGGLVGSRSAPSRSQSGWARVRAVPPRRARGV